jgi:hypothetical protein
MKLLQMRRLLPTFQGSDGELSAVFLGCCLAKHTGRTLRDAAHSGTSPPNLSKEDQGMPFYERGDVRIYYEEAGSGFPLLVTPGGGLNSRVSNWPDAVFNSIEIFKDEFRCIAMDQRNANGGESSGPIPATDPWGAFAADQLGLMDHLGIKRFLFMGYCIGGCFALKLMEQAPDRVVAAVLVVRI